jgi:hypothetical protein
MGWKKNRKRGEGYKKKIEGTAYLFPPGPVGNMDIYHSSFEELAPVVREAGQQVPLVVRQAVVHEQNRAATHTLFINASPKCPQRSAVFRIPNCSVPF